MATSKFVRFFRNNDSSPVTGAAIWLVPQADTYPDNALSLTEHATRDGVYYRANVPDGEYKIYIDAAGGSSPTLYEERLWIGENRITTISDHFDSSDSYKLKTTGIKDSAITESKIAERAVTSDKIESEAVTDTKLASGAVVEAKIGSNAVTSGKIANGSVGAGKFASTAVSDGMTITINDGKLAVYPDGTTLDFATAPMEGEDTKRIKIADNGVSASKLASNAVETAKIKDLNVTDTKLADGAVVEAKIGSNAVTSGKIANGSVGAGKFASTAVSDGMTITINDGKLAVYPDGTTLDFATAPMEGEDTKRIKIADNGVSASKLASNAVETAKIKDLNVTDTKLADGAVTTNKIAGSAIGDGLTVSDGKVIALPDDLTIGFTTRVGEAPTELRVKNGGIGETQLASDVTDKLNLWIESGSDIYRASGNVGIGTTNPGNKFSVDALSGIPTTANSIVSFRDTATNVGFQMGATSNYGWIRAVDVGVALNRNLVLQPQAEGNVGIGIRNPTCKFHVGGDKIRIDTAKTPASSTSTGNEGDICWDTNYLYVCVATNTWKRFALETW